MEEKPTELKIIESTSEGLSAFGDVEVLYATAEFQPFSNQQIPDLKFTPRSSDRLLFLEYKKKPRFGYTNDYLKSIVEHRDFIFEEEDSNMYYAFATNGKPSGDFIIELNQKNILVFESVENDDDLIINILNWANEKL